MKICQRCNQTVNDNDSFCPYCGTKISDGGYDAAQKKALYVLRRNLRHEQKCWKIVGGVFLGITIAFIGLLTLIFFAVAAATEEPIIFGVGLVYTFIYCAVLLPQAIVNLAAASKINKYLDNLDTDCGPATERCGNVGMIVLAAIFNQIALIFIIMNFVHVKSNSALLEQIRQNQTA